jgi:inorganic pyrophosphatase
MAFPEPFYRWRPHPWHGLDAGPEAPEVLQAFIELTPFDLMKYEVDKTTGYLRIDRPQPSSSQPPTLYGFIPRTYCGERVKALSPEAREGDHDPLDICVVSERPISRPEIVLSARVVGGLQMLDGGEADDKVLAVLTNDNVWGKVRDVAELPEILVSRPRHYFLTYKLIPEDEPPQVSVAATFGREHALKVVQAAMNDYDEAYGQPRCSPSSSPATL